MDNQSLASVIEIVNKCLLTNPTEASKILALISELKDKIELRELNTPKIKARKYNRWSTDDNTTKSSPHIPTNDLPRSYMSFEEESLARSLHNYPCVRLYGHSQNIYYPLKQWDNGNFGLYCDVPIQHQAREDLLLKCYPTKYATMKKKPNGTWSPGIPDKAKLREKIIVRHPRFVPNEHLFFIEEKTSLPCVNLWRPPYHWLVKHGYVTNPKRVVEKGKILPLHDKLFNHLFTCNKAKMWVRETLFSKQTTALFLIGDSRTGKSAFMQLVSSLHAPNSHTSYSLSQFCENRFAMGALEDKTFTGISEGYIKPEYLEQIKNFINCDTFDAERKNRQNFETNNYNSLMICSDRDDALKRADQAILNRCIIPQMRNIVLGDGTPVTLSDGTQTMFTLEDIKRIYDSSKGNKNPQLAKSDQLALAEYLEVFNDATLNLTGTDIVGYSDKEAAYENFIEKLEEWQILFLVRCLYPALDQAEKIDDVRDFPSQLMIKLINKANNDPDIRMAYNACVGNNYGIPQKILRSIGLIDNKIIRTYRLHGENRYNLQVNSQFIMQFLPRFLVQKNWTSETAEKRADEEKAQD